MFVRRASILGAATAALVVLSGAPALAHYCFFTDPNVNANAGRAGSSAFVTFDEFTSFTQLCDEGQEILAEAAGVSMDTLLNGRGVMAGGREGGTKTIGHLDFGTMIAAGPAAFAECGMEVPGWWFED